MEKSVEIPGQETHRYLAVHHLLPVPSHRHTAPACNPSPTDGRCASIGISTTNSCSAGDLWLVWPIMQSKGRGGLRIWRNNWRELCFPIPFFWVTVSQYLRVRVILSLASSLSRKALLTSIFVIQIFRTIRYFIITNNYIEFLTK